MNLSNQKDIRNLIIEGNFNEVVNRYKKIIQTEPNNYGAHNNLGNALKKLGKLKEALVSYRQAIKIKPDYTKAHLNLGSVLNDLDKFEEAIPSLLHAIKIEPDYSEAHHCLAISYKKIENLEKAIVHYKKADTKESRAQVLQCLYILKKTNEYNEYLSKLCKDDPKNIKAASINAFVSNQLNLDNIYPFCKNPLNFIFIKNLKKELIPLDKFSKNLSEILGKTKLIWEPSSKTTTRGYHTSGNLFEKTDAEILILRKIIEKQIIIYKEKYKSQKDYFITKWPLISKIEAWHVKLIKQGYQKSHIHPAGWLSGVFYLKVPKLLSENEGSIEFTLFGYDYPSDKNLPNLIHTPNAFDIALFPSSLFHNTIPFSSQEERHVIAFDLIPK